MVWMVVQFLVEIASSNYNVFNNFVRLIKAPLLYVSKYEENCKRWKVNYVIIMLWYDFSEFFYTLNEKSEGKKWKIEIYSPRWLNCYTNFKFYTFVFYTFLTCNISLFINVQQIALKLNLLTEKNDSRMSAQIWCSQFHHFKSQFSFSVELLYFYKLR